jgi:hypothetical protein
VVKRCNSRNVAHKSSRRRRAGCKAELGEAPTLFSWPAWVHAALPLPLSCLLEDWIIGKRWRRRRLTNGSLSAANAINHTSKNGQKRMRCSRWGVTDLAHVTIPSRPPPTGLLLDANTRCTPGLVAPSGDCDRPILHEWIALPLPAINQLPTASSQRPRPFVLQGPLVFNILSP